MANTDQQAASFTSPPARRSTRTSTRSQTAQETSSSTTSVLTATKPTRKARAMVTPSPTLASTTNDSDASPSASASSSNNKMKRSRSSSSTAGSRKKQAHKPKKEVEIVLGAQFSKSFGPHGVFQGEIISLPTPDHPFFGVQYEDGDEEDLEECQILEYLENQGEIMKENDKPTTTTTTTESSGGAESPYFARTAASKEVASSKKPVAKKAKKESTAANKKPAAAKKPKARGAAKKPAPKKETEDDESKKPAAAAAAAAAPKSKKKQPELILALDNEDNDEDSSRTDAIVVNIEEDDDDEDDKPFQVDYAPTGRATCRRCDEVILKGSLRVSHVPLFRGKPGFRVYRHLDCAVFTEDIQSVEQIGGYSKITQEEYERLVLRVEESKLELEQEQQELEPDELVQVNFEGEMRNPPPGLTATLLPFQVEGFSWMHHQEMNVPEIRGGILADEMGMGKTLQTIATILDNRPSLQHSKPGAKHPPSLKGAELEQRKQESELWDKATADWRHELKMNNVPAKMPPKQPIRAGTLVVCPVIALSQWKTEFEKFTEEGTVTIAIYHGPDRAKEFPLQKLCKYDIVLTTYQVLEHDFRKMVSPNKVTCPNCGGKYKLDKLRIHLKYFCGEGAVKTEAQARQQRTRVDRPGGRGGNGTSSAGKKKTFKATTTAKGKASKPAAKTSQKDKKVPPKKGKAKTITVDSSDSEEEVETEMFCTPVTTGRPSRSAAQEASKRVASSVKEWSASKDDSCSRDDDDSFGAQSSSESESEDEDESIMSYDDEDSEGEAISLKTPAKKATKKTATKRPPAPESSEDEDSDTENDAVLNRAIKKQAAALRRAKGGKSKRKKKFDDESSSDEDSDDRPVKKVKSRGKKGKGKAKGGKGKKKFDDESSSDEDSDDSPRGDPLEDIDLNELMDEAMSGSQMSKLHSACWWRVVLDEAHMIKSRSSSTAAAAFSLIGSHRWALSGTPLQNRVGEMYSLIRFLRMEPMAFYFCRQKGCGCKSIHYRIKQGKCQDCDHRSFSHYAHFNRFVLNPIQRDGYSGDGRRAVFKLKTEVLDKALLRRTKETRAEDLKLAPRIVSIRSIKLHPIELDFYNALYTSTKSSFDDYVAQGTVLNNFGHIFDLLSRMRQAVDHPYLIVYSKRNCEQAAASSAGQPQIANGSTDCSLCQELPTERVVSSCCGAAFCRSCVLEYMTTLDGDENASTPCPSCRDPFSIDLNQEASDIVDDSTLELPTTKISDPSDTQGPSLKELPHVNSSSILRRIDLAQFATSTKIEALVQELVEMRKARPGSKALVFSQFVNMLDLIRWRIHCDPCLSEMGLGARILHGGMDVKSRDQCLKDFREDSNVRVLLMSLKAGGVALNLTVASEVFLVDNWWNPAAEMQAIDRTHRLGQHRCIRAVRFIAEGTVEERVLQLQEKKRLVFDGTVGRDAGSLAKLSAEDMVSLFT